MSSTMIILTVAALAVAASLAHPNPDRVIRTVDLSDAVNKTVCPIRIVYDTNPDRMPRRIKMMKCESNPLQFCKTENIPDHECCHHHHDTHVMECVEMKDTVLVFYKDETQPQPFEVSVGCTCIIRHSTNALKVPGVP